MDAFIYDVIRTVRGKGNQKGALCNTPPLYLLLNLMQELRIRHHLNTSAIEEMAIGCMTQIMDQGGNIAKTAAQVSGYGDQLCAYTINRFCGSGLEAINQAAAYIQSGYKDLMLAGGVESMSRIPMWKDCGTASSDPVSIFRDYYIPQGIAADLIATMQGLTRNDLDAYAAASQQRAAQAQQNGYFSKSRIPVKDSEGKVLLDTDETIRATTTIESLGNLLPAFAEMGEKEGFDRIGMRHYPEVHAIQHLHHAGNSSGIADGAALALIGNKKSGEQQNLKPRAKIKSMALCGTDPTLMLTGPVPALEKALKQAGMKSSNIDLFEINEAFAVLPLLLMDKFAIPHAKVNVNGGAIAMGHPIGATGCVLTGTLLYELERRGLQTGMVTLCMGGGMGIATIIERL